MKKHTRATPAGIPRSRASTVRRLRPPKDLPRLFDRFVRLTHVVGFKPNPRQKYGSRRRGPESQIWRSAGALDLADLSRGFLAVIEQVERRLFKELDASRALSPYSTPPSIGTTAAPLATEAACRPRFMLWTGHGIATVSKRRSGIIAPP